MLLHQIIQMKITINKNLNKLNHRLKPKILRLIIIKKKKILIKLMMFLKAN